MLTLLKFEADWCKPCQNMKPIIENLKADFSDDIIFQDINIEHNPQTRIDYHIRSIPAFVLIKDREEIARNVGSKTETEMRDWLDECRGL